MNEEATNVLLADDDDDDYFVFSVAVQELAFTVVLTRAQSGEILGNMLEENLPDVLFLDLLMPRKDGRMCLKEIRANKRFDSLPIIVYTSLQDLANIEYCYREGSNLYCIKPNSIADLKAMLERILAIDWKKTLYFPQRSEFVLKAG